ncbi:MAG: type II toxin-antitoxin system RelE/ParE family toxin [Notoacmeibacter sp.]
MKASYRLTNEADEDIVDIFISGEGMFGTRQAEKYFLELHAKFRMIAASPLMARERTEVTPPVRAHPHKSHIIIYRIENDCVVVLGVRHAHEDWVNDTD